MANSPTPWWSKDTVAVVTGANRGIGIEIARILAEHGLTVIVTARDPGRGQAAVDGLKAQGLKSVAFHSLDLRSPESAKSLATWLKKEFGGIDILVNNAALISTSYSYEIAEDIVETNYHGLKNVTETLLPLLRASPAGARIINVTSRRGRYERLRSDTLKQKFRDEDNYSVEMIDSLAKRFLEDVKAGRADEEGWVPKSSSTGGTNPMYSESKMFSNAYAAILAKSLSNSQPKDHQIFVASYCPGATKTDVFYKAVEAGLAPKEYPAKSAAEGADTGVWLALLPKEELAEKNGKLFGEREEYSFA